MRAKLGRFQDIILRHTNKIGTCVNGTMIIRGWVTTHSTPQHSTHDTHMIPLCETLSFFLSPLLSLFFFSPHLLFFLSLGGINLRGSFLAAARDAVVDGWVEESKEGRSSRSSRNSRGSVATAAATVADVGGEVGDDDRVRTNSRFHSTRTSTTSTTTASSGGGDESGTGEAGGAGGPGETGVGKPPRKLGRLGSRRDGDNDNSIQTGGSLGESLEEEESRHLLHHLPPAPVHPGTQVGNHFGTPHAGHFGSGGEGRFHLREALQLRASVEVTEENAVLSHERLQRILHTSVPNNFQVRRASDSARTFRAGSLWGEGTQKRVRRMRRTRARLVQSYVVGVL